MINDDTIFWSIKIKWYTDKLYLIIIMLYEVFLVADQEKETVVAIGMHETETIMLLLWFIFYFLSYLLFMVKLTIYILI
jgi:hypothetical protein